MTSRFPRRTALLAAVSGAALLIAGAAGAQTIPDDATSVDDIVVTGTRAPARSRLDTLAPVDVVTAETLQNRGTTEFAAALAQTVPSLTFQRPSANDGTASTRPATLRRRSPDPTPAPANGPAPSRLDTLAPVDVVTAETLQNRGTTEFAAALAQTVPSLTFRRPSANDGTDSIRPATLRGLSPDQTLVLVNGTRRHASALVNV